MSESSRAVVRPNVEQKASAIASAGEAPGHR